MIRNALPADAEQIAELILLAMGPLAAKFANTDDRAVQIKLFSRFVAMENNQYSYQNIVVEESDDKFMGMIMAYDGSKLHALRQPFVDYIKKEHGFVGMPEDETAAGEYYIDCLAVLPTSQGQGIGSRLITALCDKAKSEGFSTIGLLVSRAEAKRLYEQRGFKVINTVTLLGNTHEHMQLQLT